MQPRWRGAARLSCLVIVSATLAFGACNTRTPILDDPVLQTAPTPVANPISGPRTPRVIELTPGGTMGGGTGRGTVFLNFPAPAGGMAVSLTSSDASVRVEPSTITVAGGRVSADFASTTEAVTDDKNVEIVASTAEGSGSAMLGVWALLPTFFSYSSDKGAPIGRGQAERFTPTNAIFDVGCSNGWVNALVRPASGGGWFISFGPPSPPPFDRPLLPGFYETSAGNRLQVDFNPATCSVTGRFTVHEAQATPDGRIARFWATFEQTCVGRQGTIRGDFRVTNTPRPVNFLQTCNRIMP